MPLKSIITAMAEIAQPTTSKGMYSLSSGLLNAKLSKIGPINRLNSAKASVFKPLNSIFLSVLLSSIVVIIDCVSNAFVLV